MKKSIFLFFAAILCAMSASAVTFTEETVIYFNMEMDHSNDNWWNSSGCYHYAKFTGTSGTSSATVHLYNLNDRDNSASAQSNSVFFATIPAGSYTKISFYRGKTATTLSSYYNEAKEVITLDAEKNKFGTIYNSNFGNWQSWSKTQETSTVALSASSSSVNESDVVTLTPSLVTNADLNTIKNVSYSIIPNTGASITGNEFTATTVGSYTIEATITYNAKGFTDITKTATATTTITVTSADEQKHDVTVSYKCGETEVATSIIEKVGESTPSYFTAPDDKDYTFVSWTLGAGVATEDELTANPISITTKSGETDYTLIANYQYIEPVIKTIYCKMEYNWWTQASAAISAFISGTYGESATSLGTLMTLAPLESNVWKIDIDVARYQKVKFIRVKSDGSEDWGAHTGLVEIPTDDKNLYTITEQNTNNDKWGTDCPGTWSVYEAPATAPKRYITGNKELVGGEGWKANEIEMTYDNGTSTYSHTFLASALTAGTEYKLKVTEGNWDGGKWGDINGTIPGVSNDGDGNVCFTLKTAGDVTITFDGSKITVSTTGEFKVPVTYPYYILGTMNSWSVKEEYGLADEDEDGVYTREMTLASGEHTFKINIGKWDSQWGWSNVVGDYTEATDASDDNKIKITLTAEKTFTVNFNPTENEITFTGLTEKVVKCYLMGIGGDWTTGIEMEEDGDQFKLLCQPIAEGEQFKFKYGDTWSDGVENHDFPGIKWVDDDNDGNSNITLLPGNYNFYYKKATNQVYVEYATYTRTGLTEGALGTICLPFNVLAGNASGATFYTLVGKDANGKVVFGEVTGELEAGKSYLFQASAEKVSCIPGTTLVSDPINTGAMKGTFEYQELTELTNIYYFAQKALWSCVDLTKLTVHANRAYVNMAEMPDAPTSNSAPGVRRITLGVNGQQVATGMENIDASAQPTKMIIDGQLYILRGEKMYDAQGKLVK